MNTSKRMGRKFAMTAVAAVALLAGGSAAFASGSFAVTAGSATSGTVVGYSAATTGAAPQVTFRDTTGGFTLNCASASVSGSVTVNPGQDSNHLGTINGAATVLNTCTGPFGLSFVVTGSNTWYIDATGSTASGVTPVRISGVNMHFAGGCSYDVTGTLNGTYTNGATSGTIDLPGTTSGLTMSNVSGGSCGLFRFRNGDLVSFKATYGVTADTLAYNPISINGTI